VTDRAPDGRAGIAGLASDAAAVFWREWLHYRRDRAYWIGQLIFPLAVIAFIGFGLNDVVSLPSGASYVGHLASGVLALIVASGGVGAGMSLIQDRESGLLRVLAVAPIATGSVVVGKLLARLSVSLLLVLVLLMLFATFTELRLANPAATLLAVAALTAFFVALGVGLATRLRSFESFRMLAGLVTVPIYLLSPLFYPLETLPAPTRWVAQLNPFTYGVDLLRASFLEVQEIPMLWSALLLVVGSALAVGLAIALFHRNEGQ
jgi:ABC-2 type transport system permease protein